MFPLNAALAACLGLSTMVGTEPDPIQGILAAFATHNVVAVGENHGHAELHELVIRLLRQPEASDRFDDIAVEWGNSLFQDVIDRFIRGEQVPWDSVTMAWRNTVVSPNTVWDSPVYMEFFEAVRQLNSERKEEDRLRVLLADSPVNWDEVDSIDDLRPFFDRARSMADVIREESLQKGRKVLFLAGGLHVAKKPRARRNQLGLPIGEITPVAWLELYHPGSTYSVQSMGNAERLGLDHLIGSGPPELWELKHTGGPGGIPANETTTLQNRDGVRPDVYGDLMLADIVDAVLVWDPGEVTVLEPTSQSFVDDWYWEELNRRSMMLRGQPMDPGLRGGRSYLPSR